MSDSSKTSLDKKSFSRINGFQRPFHPLQIVSWIYFALESISFYTLVAPSLYA